MKNENKIYNGTIRANGHYIIVERNLESITCPLRETFIKYKIVLTSNTLTNTEALDIHSSMSSFPI